MAGRGLLPLELLQWVLEKNMKVEKYLRTGQDTGNHQSQYLLQTDDSALVKI